MKPPRHLDRAFDRFDPRIAEKNGVGEGHLDEPPRQPLLAGHPIEVRCVPQPGRLFGQSGNELRMRVTEGVDRDACGEVQVSRTILGDEVRPFPPDKGKIGPAVGRQY